MNYRFEGGGDAWEGAYTSHGGQGVECGDFEGCLNCRDGITAGRLATAQAVVVQGCMAEGKSLVDVAVVIVAIGKIPVAGRYVSCDFRRKKSEGLRSIETDARGHNLDG